MRSRESGLNLGVAPELQRLAPGFRNTISTEVSKRHLRAKRGRGGDNAFARYWIQTLRSLGRPQRALAGHGAELTVDRQGYQSDEPVRFRVRFLDPKLVPDADDGAVVMLEHRGDRRWSGDAMARHAGKEGKPCGVGIDEADAHREVEKSPGTYEITTHGLSQAE